MMECCRTFIGSDKWSLIRIWLCVIICITTTHAAWFHRSSSVYYFSDDERKFFNAQEDCESKGANLVTINGNGENQFLHNSRSDNRQHWIGLHCNIPCIGGNFQWFSGSSDYRNWASDVNTNGGGYAVIAFGDGRWRLSNNPDNQKRYICEKRDGCQDPDRPCENGATCIANSTGGYTCNCWAGFRGVYCETNINECNSDPCVHGSCTDRDNRYRCDCDSGYTGQHCETDIDECADGTDDCVRDQAYCVNQVGGFRCNCYDGYSGCRCWVNIDDCDPSPCQHNGSCTDGINAYTCTCTAFYTGTHCDVDIDECDTPNFCNNGECENNPGGYQCTCNSGFKGDRCNTNINECNRYLGICQNGGSCRDTHGSYDCTCTARYTGHNCSDDVNECDTQNFCNHGACNNIHGGFLCTCERGYEGDRCDQNIDECTRHEGICQNGGICTDTEGSYECTCQPGYTGHNCSAEITECSSSPCDNGAKCYDGINHYTCDCVPQFTGTRCEEDVNECTEYDYCGEWNCTNTYGDFSCDCPWGYQGAHCDIDIDECLDGNTYPSHSNCTNHAGGFTCQCGDHGQISFRVAKAKPDHIDFKDNTIAIVLLATNVLTILLLSLTIGFIIITRKQWMTRFRYSLSAEKRNSSENTSIQRAGTKYTDAGDIKVEFDSRLYKNSSCLTASHYANVKDTAHQDGTYAQLGPTAADEQPYELAASKLYTELRVASSK